MYTDQGRVEAYLKRDLTDEEAEQVDDVIESISALIDSYTNRSWAPVNIDEEEEQEEPEAEDRLFDGNGAREIFIDDFTTIESVIFLDNQGSVIMELEDSEWLLYPLNKAVKESIRLRNYNFPNGIGNIQVKAVWGAGSAPTGVIVAATALVGKYFIRSSVTGTFKSESIEGYSYTLLTGADLDTDTAKIMSDLDAYKKIQL